VETLSHFRERSFKKPNSVSFSDFNTLKTKIDILEIDSKIMNARIVSLEKSFQDLKKEFDSLTDLCAKTVLKDK